ncbi:MAG: Phthiocerol/phenolphthiocerol synthesis polyketide synthase type I PpsC [Anaerolineales bacterium]|nr:Phthiocerol/phenolphthiocerol synthesis polyketide synthase type I PpsC [Anaerolineales bacterium]
MTRKGESNYPTTRELKREPIAIIGIGCRFPGGADSPEKFWALLRDGVHVVSEIPSNRIDVETYYDSRPATPGKIMTRWGGFLENIDQLDASFFGIAPREAERLDPQQRLLLELAWEALEDAGILPSQLVGTRTGVFAGIWLNDFEARLFADPSQTDFYMTTGSGRYSASGRLSYFLGLQGPSITIDTACSSSLVAIHLACQSLWTGESELALAGGANVILQPHITIAYSQSQMMAPDGRCKFGSAQADGYVRSEGAALVVLKRLSQAIEDRDSIYAVIRGGAVNNDGQSGSFLATPGQQGQEDMLRVAYQSAGVDPRQVQYIEAHGTGTRAGDPIELGALGAVLGKGRQAQSPLLVGSVKTNLGHTEGAAGVAGLIKVALSLKYGMIPPSLHLDEFNPNIPWQDWKLTIPTSLTPWLSDGERIAGVSAFGIAGTNAHIVLAETPDLSQAETHSESGTFYLLPLSAQTAEGLRMLAESYLQFLSQKDPASLQDICYTAGSRRVHHAERLTVLGRTHQGITEQLSAFLAGDAHKGQKITGRPKVVFVFPGQGAQWLGMGRELLKENAVFCKALTECDRAIKHWSDWSLLEQLMLEENDPAYRLNEISVIQPALFAMEVALAAVWQSWGIEASAVIGHSMGEVAAAYVAGSLSLEDAARIICKRSQLMQRASGKGAMAVVGLPHNDVENFLQDFEGKLSIAVQNSPKSTVVSGDPDALEQLMETLHSREIFCRLIKVDVASHSWQMDPIRPELEESLSGIEPRAAAIAFYSTVTQTVLDGELLNAEYWGRNLRQPVRFSETVQRLLEDEHALFIEMSPHPVLLSAIEETRASTDFPAYGFASLRRSQPESATLLGELGSLYMLGYDLDWEKIYPSGKIVSLPAYPWQRERYWFETVPSMRPARPGSHPLLGTHVYTATGEHIWETPISVQRFPYLKDHQVRGSVVFPAAAYLEMTLAAAAEAYGMKPYRIKDVSFREALFLNNEEEKILQLVFASDNPETTEFLIYSRPSQDDSASSWSLHASGIVGLGKQADVDVSLVWKDLQAQPMELTADALYEDASQRGLNYGRNFQAVTGVTQGQTGILSRIKLPDEIAQQAAKYILHPALLDACFQTLLVALPSSNQDAYLPTDLSDMESHAAPDFDREFWCHVVPEIGQDYVRGDIRLFDSNGKIILSARQLCLQRVEAKPTDVGTLFYETQWQESPIPASAASESKHWLIFADRQGVGARLAEQLQRHSHTFSLVTIGGEYHAQANRYEIDPAQAAHFKRLFQDLGQTVQEVVYLWSLGQTIEGSANALNEVGILYLMQAISQMSVTMPHLWMITRGTQSVLAKPEAISVSQATVWGMRAVIANEFPNLRCTCVDLSPAANVDELDLLARALQFQDEDQVALRNGQRYAARLKRMPVPDLNEAPEFAHQKVDGQRSFRVDIHSPGILDSLSIQPMLRSAPKAGEVEIAVKATGLNFMNVMGAMGIYPGYPRGVGPLGIECAGVIVRVGEEVTEFRPGDEVAAIAFDSLASHVITDVRLVVKKPSSLSYEEAASLPIAYLTAYYALHHLGRLQANERVLIHSATGGVGLAAIQLAKRSGAQIFATAGSPEKREYLQALGIQHVMDSRSLSFADDILKVTNGEGVDVVLNSLAGSAITKGLQVLKPYGRFLEIGKRDIYQNSRIGLLPFQKNLSYFAIDLDKMSRERPDLIGEMLHEIFELIETRQIAALPLQTFPVSQVREAFRLMAQAKHTGKLVIAMEDENASFAAPAATIPIRSDGTYLITGGFGDLGLVFARWLAKQGARHLVLLGRSQPAQPALQVINELQDAGIHVVTLQADVADLAQMSEVLSQIKQDSLPLRGVIHAAGRLADATIPQMDHERFMQAFAPKTLGAWNLHTLTADQPLDFFILFSSVAAVLGTPGQVNYAAGNAFLDALARYRHAQGLPALSINWGPWSEIGLAAVQSNRGDRLSQQGLGSIAPEQGLNVMSLLMMQKSPQVSVMLFDAGKWCLSQPAAARSSLVRDLVNQIAVPTVGKGSTTRNVRDELAKLDSDKQRRALFEAYLREQVAYVLHLAPARIALDKPLRTLGMDSLMSLELRNRLEKGLQLTLSASLIWNYPTIQALTNFLAQKMDVELGKDELSLGTAPQIDAVDSPETEIEGLSKAEVDALLKEELDAIEDLLGDE